MRSVISILALLLAFSQMAVGQTYISGNYGTVTWTPAGNPYIVIGDSWFSTLTIEAGVEVSFDAHAKLTVTRFIVNGTATDSVRFSAGQSSWNQIYFWNGEYAHEINYALFEGADNDSNGVISGGAYQINIRHCTFRNNQSTEEILALSAQSWAGYVVIDSCNFENNEVGTSIISSYPYSPDNYRRIIKNCRFYGNTAEQLIQNSYLGNVVYRCLFLQNNCTYAMRLEYGMVANCVFYYAVPSGHPVFHCPDVLAPAQIQNCIIWGSNAIATFPGNTIVQYSDIQVAYSGLGNISANPQFVNPSQEDFSLSPGSPCINSGNPGGWWCEGDGSIADMGIYGGNGFAVIEPVMDFYATAGEQQVQICRIYNMNSFPAQILTAYLVNPSNFSFQVILPYTMQPNTMLQVTITFTSNGITNPSTLLVFFCQQFAVNDTASIKVQGHGSGFYTIQGTILEEASPYYVHSHLLVENGHSLDIQPGAYMWFDSARVLKVEGNLEARGVLGDTIRLGYNGEAWGGILFNSADGENILDFVDVYYTSALPLRNGKGGCIYADNTLLTITNSYLQSNNYYDPELVIMGGGLYANNCPQISIANTIIYQCTADSLGGAIYAQNCPAISLNNVFIYGCESYYRGGALYLKNCTVDMDSSWIKSARLEYNSNTGIALYAQASDITMTRTLITDAQASYAPTTGIITLTDSSTLTMDHDDICTTWGGSQTYALEFVDTRSSASYRNGIIFDVEQLFSLAAPNNLQVEYTLLPQSWQGEGNLVGDPLMTPEYELTSGSPCIDAGDPYAPLDPDGTRSDMGVHYYPGGGAISGEVSGVWTAAGSPYLIGGDIYVPDNDTLIMEAGTEVRFLDIHDFNINGVLLINGTPGDSVSIYGAPYSSSDGVDIFFNSFQAHSRITGAHITSIKLNLMALSVAIDISTISIGIEAGSSNGNSLTNSVLTGWIHNGVNWLVIGNSIFCGAGGSMYPWASAVAISGANGDFEANDVSAYASASIEYPYSATSTGFYECTGVIAHNTISTSAYASSYSSYGIRYGAGLAHHNSINAITTGISNYAGEIRNCTIIETGNGIYNASGIVRNCIVKDCNVGYSGSFEIRYCDVWDCTTPYEGVTVGEGNLQEDPLLINDYFLSPGSPCIDAGDPDPIYNDPDGTRNDMGSNYFDQGVGNVQITLTPYGAPIEIPVSGGSFNYNIAIANTGTNQVTGQVWCMVGLPDSTAYGPVLGPVTLTFPGGFANNRDRTQNVPASAPPGNYVYNAYVGLYPDTHWDEGNFPFSKLTTGNGPRVDDWANSGESFDEWITRTEVAIPDVFALDQNYPNPFNARTVLSYQLPVTSYVRLEIYEISGRRVMSLVDGYRQAAYHQVTWDASHLSSGIYFCRMEAGDFRAVKKLVLLK